MVAVTDGDGDGTGSCSGGGRSVYEGRKTDIPLYFYVHAAIKLSWFRIWRFEADRYTSFLTWMVTFLIIVIKFICNLVQASGLATLFFENKGGI